MDEDTGSAAFQVTRTDTTLAQTVYVSTTIVHGSQNSGDYVFKIDEPLFFAVGQATQSVSVTINDDSSDESPESFGLIIQSEPDPNVSEYLAASTFTILDDDANSGGTLTAGDDWIVVLPTVAAQTFSDPGGTDTATLDFRTLSEDLVFGNVSGAMQIQTSANSHLARLSGVENFQVLTGSGDDTLYAFSGTNILLSGDGNDDIRGGTGLDIIDGGAGDDIFQDIQDGDIVNGGSGTDIIHANLAATTKDHYINAITGTGLHGNWAAFERVTGTLGSGDDTVVGGFHLDNLDGGIGTDSLVLDYSGALPDGRTATGVDFSRMNTSGSTLRGNVELSDGTLISFYTQNFDHFDVTGTDGNDVFNGSTSQVSSFYGGKGNDTLTGGTGTDLFDGGAGDDTFHQIGLVDTVVGGSGEGSVSFNLFAETTDITIDLNTGVGVDGLWTGIEQITGSLGQGDDNVTSGFQRQSLNGYIGTDALVLDYSGTLADGRTATRIDFSNLDDSSADELIYLSDGTMESIDLNGFESLTIIGTTGNDVFQGGPGHSLVVDSGAGDDTFLDVRVGDFITAGAGMNSASLNLSSSDEDLVIDLGTGIGGGSGVAWTGIQQITGRLGWGDDTVIAGFQRQSLDAFFGNDSLVLDFSGRLADGRTATRIDFSNLKRYFDDEGTSDHGYPVTDYYVDEKIYLSDGTIDSFDLSHFENWNIVGTTGNDVIVGALWHSLVVDGGAGDDILAGGRTTDQLDGGSGNDDLQAGAGADVYVFGRGNGYDMVLDSGGAQDRVQFLPGLSSVDVIVSRGLGTDLILNITSTGETLTLQQQEAAGGATRIEEVRFEDGTTWDAAELSNRASNSHVDSAVSYSLQAVIPTTLSLSLTGSANVSGTGNDLANTIMGNSGNNLLSGGAGQDTLIGGDGNDTAVGDGGADQIFGNAGDDLLDGSFADDLLFGGSGDDTLLGGIGNDQMFGGSGADSMDGGENSDVFVIDGDDIVTGTTGYDKAQIKAAAGTAVSLIGWSGVERVNGHSNNDVIDAATQTTAILLSGGFGDDSLTGGSGDDVLIGGKGDDTLVGGAGRDIMLGNSGDDVFEGGAGNDIFVIDTSGGFVRDGGAGFDIAVLRGAWAGRDAGSWTGVERINGTTLNDLIDATGMATSVTLVGAAGNDSLTGGSNGDTFFGGAGDDLMLGGTGNDALIGSSGDDTLEGGADNDFYLGGAGADSFAFAAGFGSDVVKDYTDGKDRLDFSGHADVSTMADLDISQSGNNTSLRLAAGGTDQILLVNVTATDLGVRDFDFV